MRNFKFILLAGCLLMTGILSAAETVTALAYATNKLCRFNIAVSINNPSPGVPYGIKVFPVGSSNSSAAMTPIAASQTLVIPVHPMGVTTYNVALYYINTSILIYTKQVVVYTPCNIGKLVLTRDPINRTAHVEPEDPDENLISDLQLKWALEELDPQTGDPLYKIDNPLCWAGSNEPGAANDFKGFEAENAYNGLVTQIPCTEANGTFESGKTYRITRYYRMAGETDWNSYSVDLSPQGATEKSANLTEDDADAALLRIFQDPQAKLAVLNTTVDNGILEIYDVLGNKTNVITLQSDTYDYPVDISVFPKGIYFVYLRAGSRTISQKIMIQ